MLIPKSVISLVKFLENKSVNKPKKACVYLAKINDEMWLYTCPSKSLAIAKRSLIKFGKSIWQVSSRATMDDKFIIE